MRVQLWLVTALLALPAAGAAQDTWNWARAVPQGQAIEIKGVNGSIEARAATGGEVRVTARKHARRSDVESVRLEVVEHAGGVTICAVYPTSGGRAPNECQPGEGGRNNVRDNDVNVDFTVDVPAGVRLVGRTVNGGIEADGLRGDVEVYTVNGSVAASSSGLVRARTVNGSLDVTMGRADWQDELELQTVNGGITLAVTGELNAEVNASTVNGDIETDFPLTVRGRFGPRRVTGTVGSGGRDLVLTTVNGDIELHRR